MSNHERNNERYAEVLSRAQTMRGMIHRPHDFSATQKQPAVMLWHGFTGTRVEPHRLFVKTARRLAQENILAARFDFIGSGESDGDFVDATPETEIDDALNVLAWMQEQRGIDRNRLGLIGFSLGGLVAACAAARSTQVKVLCLWAATAHIGERMRDRSSPESAQQLERRGFVDMNGNLIGRGFIESAQQLDVLREATSFSGKVLIVHGTADQSVPVEEAHEYAKKLQHCQPTLHLIPEADHTFNSWPWENEVIETTTEWLKQNL